MTQVFRTLSGVQAYLAQIEACAKRPDASLVHPFEAWKKECAAMTLHNAFENFSVDAFVNKIYHGDWSACDSDKRLQKSLYSFLLC